MVAGMDRCGNEWTRVNLDELLRELDEPRYQQELAENHVFRAAIDAIQNDEGVVSVVYELCKMWRKSEESE